MSDVTLPTELLEALWNGTDGTGAYGSTYVAIEKIRQTIRKPEVGDVVAVDSLAALPPRTVLTDKDGDIVVTFDEGTNGAPTRRITDGGRQTDTFVTAYYAPYTIVYLPEESK